MTALAPKPEWAPAIWKDSRGAIFAQFGQDVLRFEATEAGLSKLLKIIPTVEVSLDMFQVGGASQMMSCASQSASLKKQSASGF